MQKDTINKVQVRNIRGHAGREVANQFVIETPEGSYFQSYHAVIAFRSNSGKTYLDEESWDYSPTTGKYRNLFLNEDMKETRRRIKQGDYILTNLNL